MRCKPDQLCLIIGSIAGNNGKVVLTIKNHGDQRFWRPNSTHPNRERVLKKNVWSVAEVRGSLNTPAWLEQFIKQNYHPQAMGLFADADLLPLNDPDLIDSIIQDEIKDIRERNAQLRKQRATS